MGRTKGALNKNKMMPENKMQNQSSDEAKFLSDVVRDYNYWKSQPGQFAAACAEAYLALLHEFSQPQNNE